MRWVVVFFGEVTVERFGWRFYFGDKLIQSENDYDKEVFNREIGAVERIDVVKHQVVVRFDDRRRVARR